MEGIQKHVMLELHCIAKKDLPGVIPDISLL